MPYRIGAVRHGDMNQLATPVEEPVQLRSGLMAENGIRARRMSAAQSSADRGGVPVKAP